jgi:glycosyltransferase involved in cell wall biosynthesis
MRVLRVVGGLDPAFGGPSVSAVNSAIAAARAGVPTRLAFPVGRADRIAAGDVAARLVDEGLAVTTTRLPDVAHGQCRRWGVSPALVRTLAREIPRHDVVHAHGAWVLPTLAALQLARRHRRAFVLSPHEGLTAHDVQVAGRAWTRSAKRVLKGWIVRHASLIVMSSARELTDSLEPAVQEAAAVILHAVVDERRAPAARHTDRTPCAPPGELVVGYLGRLDPKKNVELLLDALALAPRGVGLVIGGDGPAPYRARLAARAARLRLAARVRWVGFVAPAAKDDFLAEVDVLAMPSRYECFGMAAAEALARGVPVVVSPDCGVAELVASEGGGLVVPREAEALAGALAALATDPEARRAHGRRGAEVARRHLSFSAHGSRLAEAYGRLVPA